MSRFIALKQFDIARAKIFLCDRAGFLPVQRHDMFLQQPIVSGDRSRYSCCSAGHPPLAHFVGDFLQGSHAQPGMLDQLRAHILELQCGYHHQNILLDFCTDEIQLDGIPGDGFIKRGEASDHILDMLFGVRHHGHIRRMRGH